ncbi:unnamed protein product [Closterium sp. NIES-64]|nr:unnamed protein product [Closterium sp. NIES-64]
MSRETFMELCGMLGPLLGKKPRKNPNLLDIRIGAAIWRLATAEPLHLVSRRFNLSRTTVHFVGNDILKVLNDVILPKTTFNECIEKGTAVGKDAIGRLKGRWRILLRRAEGKLHELPRLVGACCALHNFLEQKGEAFDPDWAYEAFDDYVPARRADEESPAAVAERDELAQGMFQAVHGWEGGS